MNSRLQNAAVRFLPSLTDVAFIMPLIFEFNQVGGAPSLLADGDTGWHLRTGEWILANGRVPHQDLFSYTHAGQPWYAWEWLWDVCFGFLNMHFGLAAVVTLSMLLICTTSAMLFRLVLRKCPNRLVAILVTIVAVAAGSIHWLARPHLFTFFFTIVFLRILDDAYLGLSADPYGYSTRKLFWLLPALTVLWTNLHGGFVAGLIIIGAYAGGGLLGALLEPASEARKASLSRAWKFIQCGILCALATLINPYFIGLHEHIFKYLTNPYFYEHIAEFAAFNFSHPASRFVEPLVVLTAATACWNLFRRRYEYALLLAGWMHMALQVQRNVPLFAFVCAPLVAEALLSCLRNLESTRVAEWAKSMAHRFEESAVRIGETDSLPRLHLASVAAIALLAAILYAPNPPKSFIPSQDPKMFPVAAANKLLRDGDDHIFSSDIWGGYLIYRMYPKAKVFIDGRSDFYGPAFGLKYLDVIGVKYDWDRTLERYGAKTVVLPADYALASALKENPRWRVVYDDKTAIVFRLVDHNRPSQQASIRPDQGGGESCGEPVAGAASPDVRTSRGPGRSNRNIVAELGPPRPPLLNRP
jgi:hypothetical protein